MPSLGKQHKENCNPKMTLHFLQRARSLYRFPVKDAGGFFADAACVPQIASWRRAGAYVVPCSLLFVPVFAVLLLCWSTSSEHQKTARQEIAARDRSWGSRGGTMHGEEYADSEHMNSKQTVIMKNRSCS